MANLLSHKPSFEWENSLINRGLAISELNLALVKASEYRDRIYKTPDFNQINLSWGNFIEFIYSYGYDEDIRRQRFPWMTQIQHVTLVNLISYFKNTTTLNATDINTLEQEFPGEGCGLLGFPVTPTPNSYVKCIDSLNALHRQFVSSFNYNERCQNFSYFKQFFVCGLTQSLNQIQTNIRLSQYPNVIERIDDAKFVGEQIHVHFNGRNPCALNIDGTWKHSNSSFTIPVQVRELLSNWGFLLPDEYYK